MGDPLPSLEPGVVRPEELERAASQAISQGDPGLAPVTINALNEYQALITAHLTRLAETGEFGAFQGTNRRLFLQDALLSSGLQLQPAERTLYELGLFAQSLAPRGLLDGLTDWEQNTFRRGELVTWLSNYLNTNPNSWELLRQALIYAYALPPTAVLQAEFLPRLDRFDAGAGSTVTTWTNTNPAAGSMTIPSLPLQDFTATVPPGVVKSGTVAPHVFGAPFGLRGTYFLVYSWTTAVANATASHLLSYVGSAAAVRPQWYLTRSAFFVAIDSAGATLNVPGPPNTDTQLNTPYVRGVSFDFTVTPPRLAIANHSHIDQHIGNPTTSTRYTVSTDPDAPNISTITGTNIPTWVDLLGTSAIPLAIGGPYQNTAAHTTTLRIHYLGVWNEHLSVEDMYAVHTILRARFCTAPFDKNYESLLQVNP